MKIKELKKGDFFTLRPIAAPTESQVWIRGDYDRSQRKFEATRFDDASMSRMFQSTREIFTDFMF